MFADCVIVVHWFAFDEEPVLSRISYARTSDKTDEQIRFQIALVTIKISQFCATRANGKNIFVESIHEFFLEYNIEQSFVKLVRHSIFQCGVQIESVLRFFNHPLPRTDNSLFDNNAGLPRKLLVRQLIPVCCRVEHSVRHASGIEDIKVFTDKFRSKQPRPARRPIAILVEQGDNETAFYLLNDACAASVVGQLEQCFAI